MSSRILVGNLSTASDENQIRELFEKAGGTIVSITIPQDAKTGACRGYAFVEMATRLEAEQAIDFLKTQASIGRNLSFELAEQNVVKKGKWYKFGAV
jgi:RNA recognition motif-containing protein